MSTPQQQRLIGQTVAGRYHILELVGEGGMGAVYMAEHTTLKKHVALKVIHAEHAGNTELGARFAREAMATSRIDHPNVISALDFGQLDDGTAYLAVQFVRGPSLTRVLEAEGRLPWQRAAHIGAQIADALCAAHGHGIVHRDLKPDNVLLQPRDDGTDMVKVLDFGVAKFTSMHDMPPSARKDVTQVGIIVGTPGYMSPEQALGSGAKEQADLYALGVILWQSMVGRPLWQAPDLQRLVETQLVTEPAALRAACGDESVPEELQDLVKSLLAKRPEDRPPDAASVRDALRDMVGGDTGMSRWSTGARPVPLRAVEAPATPAPEASPSTPSPRPSPASAVSTSAPPSPPEARPARRSPAARLAWMVTTLLTVFMVAAVAMVATGLVELRTRGKIAEVMRDVAQQLHLPLPVAALSSNTGLPVELDPTFARMVAAEELDERKSAADQILAYAPPDEVPVYARHMAYLQLAKTCKQKRQEVQRLSEVGDARALPLLLRLSARPTNGCGRKRRDDCLACMREDLAQAISHLEQRSTAAVAP